MFTRVQLYTLIQNDILKPIVLIYIYKIWSKATSGFLHMCGPECGSAHDVPVPERGGGGGGGGVPQRGELNPIVIISYKGYSSPKCSYNDQTNPYTSK